MEVPLELTHANLTIIAVVAFHVLRNADDIVRGFRDGTREGLKAPTAGKSSTDWKIYDSEFNIEVSWLWDTE